MTETHVCAQVWNPLVDLSLPSDMLTKVIGEGGKKRKKLKGIKCSVHISLPEEGDICGSSLKLSWVQTHSCSLEAPSFLASNYPRLFYLRP